MSDIVEAVKEKIVRIQKELHSAETKAYRLRAEADDLTKRASELQIVLRHLKNWEGDITKTDDAPISSPNGSGKTKLLSISHIVTEALHSREYFTTAQLVEDIQDKYPEAKYASIVSQLSRAKRQNQVTADGNGGFKSNLFERPASTESSVFDDDEGDELTDPFNDGYPSEQQGYSPPSTPVTNDSQPSGGQNEPGPTFGRLTH